MAAACGFPAAVRVLLDGGADPQRPCTDGKTPLHIAAQNGHAAVMRRLLEAGAPPSPAMAEGGPTPLHFAAADGNPEVLTALLEAGADLHAADRDGDTPLHWAVLSPLVESMGGNPERAAVAVALLVAAGCDPLVANERGASPLVLAADNGLRQLEDMLRHALAHGGGGAGAGLGGGPSCRWLLLTLAPRMPAACFAHTALREKARALFSGLPPG